MPHFKTKIKLGSRIILITDLWRKKYNDVVLSDKRKRRINHMVYTPYISIGDYSALLFMTH